MRRALTIVLCAGCWLAAGAQTTFTQQLQQSKTGEGKVTVTQDKSIDELVNNPSLAPVTPSKSQTSTITKPGEKTDRNSLLQKDANPQTDTTVLPDSVDLRKKVMKGQKVNGWRVQVFAGGNGRNDRLKAQRTGEEIKTLFPNEPVYVHFYSPRWICRMGNYRTYEEAHDILRQVKQMGYPAAVIVKGKINVYYP